MCHGRRRPSREIRRETDRQTLREMTTGETAQDALGTAALSPLSLMSPWTVKLQSMWKADLAQVRRKHSFTCYKHTHVCSHQVKIISVLSGSTARILAQGIIKELQWQHSLISFHFYCMSEHKLLSSVSGVKPEAAVDCWPGSLPNPRYTTH